MLSNISEYNDNKEGESRVKNLSSLECGSKFCSSNNSFKRKLLVDFIIGQQQLYDEHMIVAKTKVQVRGSHGS